MRYFAASVIALSTGAAVVAGFYFTHEPACLFGLLGLIGAVLVAEPDLWPYQ